MKSIEINVGDVVQLKSGGPKMVVDKIDHNFYDHPIGWAWFSKNDELKNSESSLKTTDINPTQTKVSEPENDSKPFCLVLASHVTKKNAQAFVEKLQEEGYEDARVVIKGKTVRVVYGYYTNESKAYNALNHLNDRNYFEDAWVYKI